MRRLLLIVTLCATTALAEEHGRREILWVKYDPETKILKLSDGQPLAEPMTPGQIVGYGRAGNLRAFREWRPPQDIEVAYKPAQAPRVIFSHERHFGALGAKNCKACHDEKKGLGKGNQFPSLAANVDAEPHGEKSVGRFCANCHRDNFSASQIPDVKPPANVPVFTAFGKTGDAACARCHAPADHRTDFTGSHGGHAEHGARQCVECHRGATAITQTEQAQAQEFQQAQLSLVTNPEDAQAFQHTLPNNFCAYCHSRDRRPWRGEEGGRDD